MTTDFTSYEHKPGAGKTLVSDPNTGQPVEVDVDEFGVAKTPDLIPTYRPSAEEIAAARKPAAGGATNPASPELTVAAIQGILSASGLANCKTNVTNVAWPSSQVGSVVFTVGPTTPILTVTAVLAALAGVNATTKTNVAAVNVPADPATGTIAFVLTTTVNPAQQQQPPTYR